jgi:hypothetical protein
MQQTVYLGLQLVSVWLRGVDMIFLKKHMQVAPLLLCSLVVQADLVAMDEMELSAATGEGLGFALENFILDAEGSNLKVTGIQSPYDFNGDGQGDEIEINWTELYIGGEVTDEDRANGVTELSANIGSYLNPWVIQTVRGGGVTSGDTYYDANYSSIQNDIALFEIATDSYDSPLQNSASYGQYAYFDAIGPGTASENIQADIDEIQGIRGEVINQYSSLGSFEDLRSSIDASYRLGPDGIADTAGGSTDSIQYQETLVEPAQDLYNQRKSVESGLEGELAVFRDLILAEEPAAFDPENGCVFTEECSVADSGCGGTAWFPADNACNAARAEYNDIIPSLDDAEEESIDAREDLIVVKNELNARLNAKTGSGLEQYSYLERVRDRDSFMVACGKDGSFNANGCESGKLGRRTEEKARFDSILISLNNGEARRRGLDIKTAFEFNVLEENGDSRSDYLSVNMNGVFIDGTTFRFWSRDDENGESELNGELRLNLFAKNIDINACGDYCRNANGSFDQVKVSETTLHLNNLLISLNLGYGDVQPMKFGATSDGNFTFTLVEPDPTAVGVNTNDSAAMEAFYDDYYANAPKSFVYVGDVVLGNDANSSIGSLTVDGFRAQYLKVQSRDL